MDFTEKKINENYVYKGKIIKVRRDDIETAEGAPAIREVVMHNGGAAVIALTDKDEILLVRQYRYAVENQMIEIPAGKLEPNEDPFDAINRELREETGATAKKVTSLGWFYVSPGYVTEKLYLYLAEGLTFGEQDLDPDEYLDVIKMPFSEALDLAMKDGFHDAKTDMAIMKYALLRGINYHGEN